MLKNSELRPGDTLQFINFGDKYPAELEKIKKFIKKQQGEEYSRYFVQRLNTQEKLQNCRGTLNGHAEVTEKTKTEFVGVSLDLPNKNKVAFKIQTRYFKIVERKSNHKFTKMFLRLD